MAAYIKDRAEIQKHLRTLRYYDNRAIAPRARQALDAILEMHQVTVDFGPTDYWGGAGIPLKTTLSLFDDEARRNRVSEIRIAPPIQEPR